MDQTIYENQWLYIVTPDFAELLKDHCKSGLC